MVHGARLARVLSLAVDWRWRNGVNLAVSDKRGHRTGMAMGCVVGPLGRRRANDAGRLLDAPDH